jgi:hypothetical protein
VPEAKPLDPGTPRWAGYPEPTRALVEGIRSRLQSLQQRAPGLEPLPDARSLGSLTQGRLQARPKGLAAGFEPPAPSRTATNPPRPRTPPKQNTPNRETLYDTELAARDWGVQQIVTSANWGGVIGNFFTGGLNLQVRLGSGARGGWARSSQPGPPRSVVRTCVLDANAKPPNPTTAV